MVSALRSYVVVEPAVAARMKAEMLMLCSMLFVGALFVADITSVKLFSYHIFGYSFLLPGGTLAFAVTFLATDVMCEITGARTLANKVVFIALSLRILGLLYYHLIIGDTDGRLLTLNVATFWGNLQQQHLTFVLGGTARIAAAGVFSAAISFMIDTYIFNGMRKRDRSKGLYWLRNSLSTMASQVVNSCIFISLAFGGQLTVTQIMATTFGQILWKIAFAWLDTPLAYFMRNYGQGRRNWYAFWKGDFYYGGDTDSYR